MLIIIPPPPPIPFCPPAHWLAVKPRVRVCEEVWIGFDPDFRNKIEKLQF